MTMKMMSELFGYLYDLLITESIFAGITLLRDGILGRRNSLFPVVHTHVFSEFSFPLNSYDCKAKNYRNKN
jgi:hypothetical protein